MLSPVFKTFIIGMGLFSLSACTALRLGYGAAPNLSYWWLDSYFDFTAEQAPKVKEGLQQWFAWHRSTQLLDYAEWLKGVQAHAGANITAAQACQWMDEVRERLQPAVDQALPKAAPLLPSITAAQLKHMAERNAKANEQFRAEFQRVSLDVRHERMRKRLVGQYEEFYGRLNEAQRAAVAEMVAQSAFDPELVLKERQARQAETMDTLRRLSATPNLQTDESMAALRALVLRMQRSPRPDYRAYTQKVTQAQCANAARMHNLATTAQREAFKGRLKGWEEDLRALAAQGAGGANGQKEPLVNPG